MTISIPLRAQSSSRWLLVLSVLIMAAGVVVILAPQRVVIAWMLLFVSGLNLAFAWPFRPAASALWQVLQSVAYVAIGLYLLGHTTLSIASIRLPVAAYLLIDGLLEWALLSRVAYPGSRPWLLLDAIATIAIATMVGTAWPSQEGAAMAMLIGINIVLGGLRRLFVSLSLRRAI